MKYFGLTISIFLLVSCANYYNKTIRWIDEIPVGTKLDSVKTNLPSYFKVDWNSPVGLEDSVLWYPVSYISCNYDFLNMETFLVFKNGKYIYRESRN